MYLYEQITSERARDIAAGRQFPNRHIVKGELLEMDW